MKVVVEGCCHGELDKIYETITHLEKRNKFKVDLLLICGDFQSVRNYDDLQAMAVPKKFQKLNSFYKYYSGEAEAPVLTIFIGGNHEASNFLQELPYGGWVAKNIYYMGYAGIVQVGGVRIGGISGIYKGHDYNKGHFERPPYSEDSKRSVYHVRNLEVFRLKQISRHVDIFMSHDWPEGVYHHGNMAQLIRFKPFFKDEIEKNCLGSKPCAELLKHLKPTYWFAAHLHAKFAAHVEHEPSDTGDMKTTKFLALDKCLPGRRFLQVIDIPHNEEEGLKIKLDPEWLTVLQSTNHLLSLSKYNRPMPGPNGNERYNFTCTDSQLRETVEMFGGDLTLPENFEHTAAPLRGNSHGKLRTSTMPLTVIVNPQTTLLCTMLSIMDPNVKFSGNSFSSSFLSDKDVGLMNITDDTADNTIDDSPSFFDSSLDVTQLSQQSPDFVEGGGGGGASDSNGNGKSMVDVGVNDDDEEFLSILSAQKKINVDTSSSSLPQSSSDISSISAASSGSKGNERLFRRQSIADRLKALKQSEDSSSSSSSLSSVHQSSTSEASKNLENISEPKDSNETSIISKDSDFNASEFKKRNSSESNQLSDERSSKSVKKMKRRNVSMYEEPQE